MKEKLRLMGSIKEASFAATIALVFWSILMYIIYSFFNNNEGILIVRIFLAAISVVTLSISFGTGYFESSKKTTLLKLCGIFALFMFTMCLVLKMV